MLNNQSISEFINQAGIWKQETDATSSIMNDQIRSLPVISYWKIERATIEGYAFYIVHNSYTDSGKCVPRNIDVLFHY